MLRLRGVDFKSRGERSGRRTYPSLPLTSPHPANLISKSKIISTVLCVGVIGHQHSGIGGGGFALVRASNGSYDFVDFREAAPGASNASMMLNSSLPSPSLVGGLASGIPGELRGLEELHRLHGKLPWARLFAPAIGFAENGFVVNRDLSNAADVQTYPFLVEDPAWAEIWALRNGSRVPEGARMFRKRYAKTLRDIARGGPRVFYEGPRAARIVAEVQRRGGVLTLQDLEGYRVKHRAVSGVGYKGYRLFSGSAPSSGAVALSALKIFEGWEAGAEEALETHRLVEGIKFAYGQRTELGSEFFGGGREVSGGDVEGGNGGGDTGEDRG
jgi:gamma-glutamyltranspeptidase/glutathione hydrolase